MSILDFLAQPLNHLIFLKLHRGLHGLRAAQHLQLRSDGERRTKQQEDRHRSLVGFMENPTKMDIILGYGLEG